VRLAVVGPVLAVHAVARVLAHQAEVHQVHVVLVRAAVPQQQVLSLK
jgi:hypothetical protein